VTRYRLTVDVELDAQDPGEARRAIYAHTEELRAALDVSSPAEVEDAAEHAFLDAIEHALAAEVLADGTPVLAPLDAIDTVDAVERRAIVRALQATRGHIAHAAKALRMGRNTLYVKMRQHGLDTSRGRGRAA
jgi:transcriptional regulator of acetoin/glycerol metabolism